MLRFKRFYNQIVKLPIMCKILDNRHRLHVFSCFFYFCVNSEESKFYFVKKLEVKINDIITSAPYRQE